MASTKSTSLTLPFYPLQLSGVSAEDLQLKACLSHGKRLIPTLSAHFDPYSDYPLPPPPISVHAGSTQKEREENREEMSLGRMTAARPHFHYHPIICVVEIYDATQQDFS